MDPFLKTRKFLDLLIYRICSVILILMVLDVTWQVTSRYILNNPASFTDEGARFLMVWLGVLGGALLFGRNGHLAVTFVTDKLNQASQKTLNIIIYIVIAVFAIFAMIYGIRTMLQPSPAINIPMGYVYSIIPIGGFIILIYIVLNIVDILKGRSITPQEDRAGE